MRYLIKKVRRLGPHFISYKEYILENKSCMVSHLKCCKAQFVQETTDGMLFAREENGILNKYYVQAIKM